MLTFLLPEGVCAVPEDYAEARIKEALRLAGGDASKAREQVIAWAYKDFKLLMALAEPYLQGLVAYNMEQLDAGISASATPAKSKKTKTGKGTDFGLGILKAAVSSRAEIFGLETQSGAREKEASQEHIDAILKIAKKTPFKKS